MAKASLFATVVASLNTCIGLYAQAVLTTPSSFEYAFNGLPFVTVVGGFPPQTPDGQLRLSLSGFDAGDVMRVEMFENSLGGTPVYSGDWNIAPGHAISVPGAWQDLQGGIRLTMLSGSVVLDSFDIAALVPFIGPGGTQRYAVYASTVVPVPEPAILGLVAASIPAWYLARRFNKALP